MSDPEDLSPEMKKKLEDEKKKFLEENRPEVTVRVESETQLQQQRLWDDAREGIRSEYEKRGITFDPNSVKTKEDIEAEFSKLQKMRTDEQQIQALQKASAGASGAPLTGEDYRGTGNSDFDPNVQSKGDRPVEFLKKIASEMPIDMMQFNSETEMLKTLEAISHDTNHPSQKEAERLYQQVLAHTFQRTGTVEFQGEGKEFGKKQGKWKKKQGVED